MTFFCQETSIAFHDAFHRLLKEYQTAGGRTSDTMVERMRELEFDMPTFEIHVGDARYDLLGKLGVHVGRARPISLGLPTKD